MNTEKSEPLKDNPSIKNTMSAVDVLKKVAIQSYYILKKNLILQYRYWPTTLCQIFISPLAFLLIVYIIQSAFNSNTNVTITNPPSISLPPVVPCTAGFSLKKSCITLMYAPKGSQFDDIVKSFVNLQSARGISLSIDDSWTPALDTYPSNNLGIVGVQDSDFMYEYIDNNPNITLFGLVFNQGQDPLDSNLNKIEYQIWYNYSLTQRKFGIKGAPPFVSRAIEPMDNSLASLARGIDEAIYVNQNSLPNNQIYFDISTKPYPDLPGSAYTSCPDNPDEIFENLGKVFMYGSTMVVFLIVINNIVSEKENRLKDAMETVGLYPFVYWLTHLISYSYIVVLNSLVMAILGIIFKFDFFLNTDFGIVFAIFFMFGLSSVAFAMFISSTTRSVKTGVGFGVFFVIIGFIYTSSSSIVAYLWYKHEPGGTDFRPGWVILMFFPFFNYTKIIADIFAYTSRQQVFSNGDCIIDNGMKFNGSMLSHTVFPPSSTTFAPGDVNQIPVPGQSLALMFMNLVFWFYLAYYLDQIIPNENGYCQHPLFFLFPSYWGFETKSSKDKHKMKSKEILMKNISPASGEDAQVTSEREVAMSANPNDYGLCIVGLNKRYDDGLNLIISWLYKIFYLDDSFLSKTPGVKCAINELSLTVNKGDLLALLGSNGAGKTSTMKILYGASEPTLGDAFIFGESIRSQMNEIRQIIGVCPQFDLLYADLSAKEHVELFCGIKGISYEAAQDVMQKRLKHMKLWDVRDQKAGQYSGGMKRRLSVVLATLGDPICLFLDEPTTGMDPVNKRFVWSFLEEFKKGRVIILTTHSMEEADILGYKVAIMTKGNLKAVGKSISLKNKFGDGYRVTLLIPNAANVAVVKKAIEKVSPEAKLAEEEYVGNAKDSEGGKEQATANQNAKLVYNLQDMNQVKVLVSYVEECARKKKKAEEQGNRLSPDDIASMISSFGISQATLEDVFLKLIK